MPRRELAPPLYQSIGQGRIQLSCLTTMHANWRRAALFFFVTFAATHTISLGYVFAGGSWGTPSSYVIANALMICPAAVAFALQRVLYGTPVLAPLALRFGRAWWLLFAWLVPPLVMLSALGLTVLLPGARYAADMGGLPPEMASVRDEFGSIHVAPILALLALGLALGPTLNAIGGLGEEVGWRGFLYRELAPTGFWRCSLLTGAAWAAWHVPLVLEGYGDRAHPVANALGVVSFAVLLAPILHLVRRRSGSVVACGVLHGTMSSTRLLSVAFVTDAGPLANAVIPVVLVAVNVVLYFAVDGKGQAADEELSLQAAR